MPWSGITNEKNSCRVDDLECIIGLGMKRLEGMGVDLDPHAVASSREVEPKGVKPEIVNLKAARMTTVTTVHDPGDHARRFPRAEPQHLAFAPAGATVPKVLERLLEQGLPDDEPAHIPPLMAPGCSSNVSQGFTPASRTVWSSFSSRPSFVNSDSVWGLGGDPKAAIARASRTFTCSSALASISRSNPL